MRLWGLLQCVAIQRHDWQSSRKKPGYETCARCRVRRKQRNARAPARS